MKPSDPLVRRRATFILGLLEVTDEFMPPLDQPFYYRMLEKDMSWLLLLRYPGQNRMFILELL